jgi:hypothetical protein
MGNADRSFLVYTMERHVEKPNALFFKGAGTTMEGTWAKKRAQERALSDEDGPSQFDHVGSLHAFRSFHDFKADRLTFGQRLESVFLDSRIMDEHDGPVLSVNESKSP